MLTKYREELITGIEEFDDLNEELFTKVEELMTEARSGNAGQCLGRFLWFLQRYVRKHFRAEEQLQRSLGFSGYPAHKEQHDLFFEQVSELQARYGREGNSTVLIVSVIKMLSDWSKTHIKTFDREAANFFRKVGG
ncbi:bacteriohemerythrin [Geobacter sp. OR-1]|uniref:bacteriohemerythrin n=1 Tax=Geobacter sp. OR-1 TaxID=1266765 RepID=UPI000541E269|nr:bacteriohemerythrin [Geobacter sp. OR-1]GAM11032.1 bacteriohemerythrin [Geobacter sp. OR-1]